MLENLDLTRETGKAEFKKLKDPLEVKLGELQRRAREAKVPVVIIFEGWDAAGKGTLINELILPLDPRGFTVTSASSTSSDEEFHPFLWRFWCKSPARGRIAIFDRSWYRRVLAERVEGGLKGRELEESFDDIRAFERQLADDGCVILKFFLHISKDEQKKRFRKLAGNRATAWRVTDEDLERHKLYTPYLKATEDMLARTDSEFAPWTVVEAHDRRFATLKIFNTVISALATRLDESAAAAATARTRVKSDLPDALRASVLDHVDPTLTVSGKEYDTELDKAQKQIRELEHECYSRRVPVIAAFEGWDAAGKGGNIKRLTEKLDPRGYEVIPIAAPDATEKAHHYLWRFWNAFPKAGHIAIFDRTWYGRVLVERVEGFCSEAEWRRAYREINEMERHLANAGGVLLKFWLHISKDEQLRRFREREKLAEKQWKITAEDWRNRKKWNVYKAAVDEMLFRTDTPAAPWTVVESNCKHHARLKVLHTVIAAIEKRLKSG